MIECFVYLFLRKMFYIYQVFHSCPLVLNDGVKTKRADQFLFQKAVKRFIT